MSDETPTSTADPTPPPLALAPLVYRLVYTVGMYLMTPVIVYRLALRGLRYREYFSRWKERFGFFARPDFDRAIWVHAVSVGEVNAAVPLIEALMRRYRGEPFVITTVTPTGSERVRSLFGDRVFHVYLPYDLPASVRRFLDRIRPRLAVVMETEIWPNLFIDLRRREVPIVMANARLSARSLKGYGPVRPLARQAIRCATHVSAQSQTDAERLTDLGALPERLSIDGNVKFDMSVPANLAEAGQAMRADWGSTRPVWVAASTHEGEEAPVLAAHREVLARFPDALLLIAPRHPERFRAVLAQARQLGLATSCRSEDQWPGRASQCFVIDTMGELLRFFAAADVAFVAGSFDPIGGHNVLEPAALSVPVLVGPHTFNFAEITASLIDDGAAERVPAPDQLGTAVIRLLGDPGRRDRMGRAGFARVERQRGAVARVMGLIGQVAERGSNASN